jgi:uncharacterized alpha-E superfamily protein
VTLLSRAAEAVYWTGRYLERVETTARIVQTHTSLYLDLPRSAGLTWAPLLTVTGCAELFDEVYPSAAEDHVVEFLTTDGINHGSVLGSLAQARENVRTTRAIFPREVWEALNNLFNDAVDTSAAAVPRGTRHRWLGQVIERCQMVGGVMSGTMTHDEAWSFLVIGRHLERADMTSRVLDVRAGTLVDLRRDEQTLDDLRPYVDLQWQGVLRSLAAYQAYRRKVHTRVQGAAVLQFLLQDPAFPRSVSHCMDSVASCLEALARHADPLDACLRTQQFVDEARVRTLAWEGLHEFVDSLQLELARVHESVDGTYFRADPAERSLQLATA